MHRISLLAAACWLALTGPTAIAQTVKPPAAAVSPEIRAAVERMATALRALQGFELKADVTTEEVLDTGQKVQSSSVVTAASRRPDRLFVDLASERRDRKFYYDGKALTIYGTVTGYYATVPAPPTTYQMLEQVADRYDVQTPLADLFQWGAGGVRLDKVRSAMYAGPDRIGGQLCDHYAFRQEGADWQLWIRKEGPSLPCKLVIVNTDDSAQPQSTMVFDWSPDTRFPDDKFVFTPPTGAQRITLDEARAKIAKSGSK